MSKINDYNEIKSLCNDFYSEMDKIITQAFCDLDDKYNEYFCDLKKYLFGSSKQIRSCLIFLFSKNFGYTYTDIDIVKLAAATEIIHNATLIHDDIIDESSIRRGNISLHEKYSNKLGVISGDFLLSVALNLLLDLPSQVMKNFGVCLNSLCIGEINQYFSKQLTPTIEEYLKKSELKTSALFVAALKSLFDMRDSEYSPNAELFALHFGRAFQIKDDLKNIINITENKPVLNDISQGIFTAPVIYEYGEMQDLSKNSSQEIIARIKDGNAIGKTRDLLSSEIKMSINQLMFFPKNEYLDSICLLCELLKK